MRWSGILIFVWTLIWMVFMKQYEQQFVSHGLRFNIMDLELPENQQKLSLLFDGMTPEVLEAVRMNIYFDFGFLLGIFGFVAWCCAALSLIHQRLNNTKIAKVLLALAIAQAVAATLDITEDLTMLSWLQNPTEATLYSWFKPIVLTKFAIVFIGIAGAILALILRFRYPKLSTGTIQSI